MPVGKSMPESGWWINLMPKDFKITPQNEEIKSEEKSYKMPIPKPPLIKLNRSKKETQGYKNKAFLNSTTTRWLLHKKK